MRARTVKRAADERIYRKRAKDFLEAHPMCLFPACALPASEVHHMRGRRGADLLDERFWLPLCAFCHRFVTEHPARAFELGVSVRRIGRAS